MNWLHSVTSPTHKPTFLDTFHYSWIVHKDMWLKKVMEMHRGSDWHLMENQKKTSITHFWHVAFKKSFLGSCILQAAKFLMRNLFRTQCEQAGMCSVSSAIKCTYVHARSFLWHVSWDMYAQLSLHCWHSPSVPEWLLPAQKLHQLTPTNGDAWRHQWSARVLQKKCSSVC